jgi:N-acylneuraminate cytidylyltransferase
MMKHLAVIPARGGSKRVPRKNVRPFLGRPLLAYSIDAARASGLFDRVLVSTDDPEIAEVARTCGAEVPFLRPAALADDHASASAVVRHAIGELAAHDEHPEYVTLVYATAPMLSPDDLRRGFALLEAHPEKAYALTVTSFPFPIQRAVRILEGGVLDAFQPEHRSTRSQDLEHAFHDAGQFCMGRTRAWLEGEIIFSPATLAVRVPRERVQDIDTPEDWRVAELLYQALQAAGQAVP